MSWHVPPCSAYWFRRRSGRQRPFPSGGRQHGASRRSMSSPKEPATGNVPSGTWASACLAVHFAFHALDGLLVDRVGLMVFGLLVIEQRVLPLLLFLIHPSDVVERAGLNGFLRDTRSQR